MATLPHNPLQPEVTSFFETALEGDSLSHAYLFVGAHPQAQLDMARNLAAALVESDRSLIDAGTHPDVREFKPGSAAGYLLEQISELINDVQLSPSRAKRKVFIVQDAQALTDKAANALLKTLEEPPPDVVFFLLARSKATVLPTIVSRAQLIRFRHEDEKELVSSLMQKMGGCSEAQILSALHVASSPQAAQALLGNANAWHAQKMLLEAIATLPSYTTWQLLQKAQEVLTTLEADNMEITNEAQANAPSAANRVQGAPSLDAKQAESSSISTAQQTAAQQAAIEKEFLSSKALKELEKAQKCAQKAASSAMLDQLFVATELFLRDIVALKAGATETTLALPDTLDTTRQACSNWDLPQSLLGIELVQTARKNMQHNVAPRLALEAMLCHMEDELCQK